MAELEAAERRLSAALERLQKALNRRIAQAGGPRSQGVEQLTTEQAGLAEDVTALRDECQTLRAVTDHVAQRLDGSIDELDRLLEG